MQKERLPFASVTHYLDVGSNLTVRISYQDRHQHLQVPKPLASHCRTKKKITVIALFYIMSSSSCFLPGGKNKGQGEITQCISSVSQEQNDMLKNIKIRIKSEKTQICASLARKGVSTIVRVYELLTDEEQDSAHVSRNIILLFCAQIMEFTKKETRQ